MARTPILPSYWPKIGAVIALTVAADLLLFDQVPGSVLGLLAMAWVGICMLIRKAWIHDRRGRIAAILAALFALILFDRPSLLAWILFGVFMMIAMQSARVRSGEDAWRWGQRLLVNVLASFAGPLRDAARLLRIKGRHAPMTPFGQTAKLLIVPSVGALVFGGLFALANPVFADLLARLRLPALGENQIARIIFWGLCAVGFYGVLRPRWRRRLIALPERTPHAATLPVASIILSLAVFNLIFALQNGLDIAFLWSGARLPEGMTLADYAHRGAYPLIGTALLAGLFVLVFLRPASATAKDPWVRRLVTLWVGQNLFLVASSLLRTADYIEVFGLTRLRLAAMVWMVLVGAGLGFIFWRLLKDKSASWLVNANVLTALSVLGVVSAIDLGAIAARWNVIHASETSARSVELDLCYLHTLGGAAVLPLAQLEARTAHPLRKAELGSSLAVQTIVLKERQSNWHSWRWRDARRLKRLQEINPASAANPVEPVAYHCDY